MANEYMHENGTNRILLFGPQALSFQNEDFEQLRSAILDGQEHSWVLDVIAELSTYWEKFEGRFPKFRAIQGGKLLGDLANALKTGDFTSLPSRLPNILLSPLVVLTQLTQYTNYLRIKHKNVPPDDLYASQSPHTETMGYCMGLLTAMAVSSATDGKQFKRYGAVAMRLAVLISGLVDAQEVSSADKETRALATICNSQEAKMKMESILQRFNKTYVSVLHDENRATITSPRNKIPALQQEMRAAGIIATEINLQGRFHCPCYSDDIEALIDFCDAEPELQFSDLSKVVFPMWSSSGNLISKGKLHNIALRSILVEQSNWYAAFCAVNSSRLRGKDSLVICFGSERCVPPSLLGTIGPQIVYMNNVDEEGYIRLASKVTDEKDRARMTPGFSENDIAVIGMSIKVAGADDLEEFWKILCEGKSQHIEVPEERFGFETQWRDVDAKRKWFGNFVRDHDAFDHKFFKRTPREAISLDPQQRLILQAAYQAVEQSGYFNKQNIDTNVGCYLGVCSVDYENNIACHPANAFSATGTLRSFIAGKVSHHFGWTGPGLTIDTACSASAVAIHQACKAILSGDCTAALAGGTMIMTSPLLFQNLAGASFLSPTGACKPFDAKADGYCRGEGIATVFLKKMSQAVTDGDVIHGCIASTAVQQNENSTPIFVPNASSLSKLFKNVTERAGLEPHQISLIEAHGTGTVVGDPAEYESIRMVFGGSSNRAQPLPIGSVKGLVGHTESVSGVIALIKILLMIQEGVIPPQASFQSLSPHIKASPSDMMEVVTKPTCWDVDFRAALINNYGASGSNASLIVTQPSQHGKAGLSCLHTVQMKHPFWLTGLDERSLRENAARLLHFLRSKIISARNSSLANIAFNVSRQSNRCLNAALIFSCSSVEELEENLSAASSSKSELRVTNRKPARPVILCFGGQISTFIGLDQNVYNNIGILRTHLDNCNFILEENGFESLYPEIFGREPVQDPVKLQTMLFALQYSVAQTWLECGVEIAAIVGHSFGELTGLCVSGMLSLESMIKVVAARAKLVKESWGADSGSMMAVQADLDDVKRLLAEAANNAESEQPATIACFNGPRSFTLAGPSKAIDSLVNIVSMKSTYSSMKTKKLNVMNAFHSSLVEPLLPNLEQLGQGLEFRKAKIALERATESESNTLSPTFFADHMRKPVYFNNAIQRLSKAHPSAIWLEAGSNSTITVMAGRAIGSPSNSHFQPVNITSDKGLQNLADLSVNLWKEGLNMQFWPHHRSQTYEYSPMLLPPYQFEKSRHWLGLKTPLPVVTEVLFQSPRQQQDVPSSLYSFVGYQDNKQRWAKFRVNTMIKKYDELVSGHLLVETAPICPATVEVDIATEAILSLHPNFLEAKFQIQIKNVENKAPICVDASRSVWLDAVPLDSKYHHWEWRIFSTGSTASGITEHVSGQILFTAADNPESLAEFAKYERLFGHQRCLSILEDTEADDIIQGRNIYKAFAPVVDYGHQYRGLQKLVGKGNLSAGRVLKEYSGETWLDAYLADCFCQVGGIWVNCMTSLSPKDMYIANKIEHWIRSPKLGTRDARPKVWDVFAYHHKPSEKAYVTDIFIFDSTNGALAEIILGINYAKVSKQSMSKMLSRLSPGITQLENAITTSVSLVGNNLQSATSLSTPTSKTPKTQKKPKTKKKAQKGKYPNISDEIQSLLAELVGLEPGDIDRDTNLADIGIDSLMGMELAHEIEGKFRCSLPAEDLVEVTTMESLVQCVVGALDPMPNSAKVHQSATDELEEGEESRSDNSDDQSTKEQIIDTPSEAITISTQAKVDIVGYLAKFLGLNKSEVDPNIVLRDLGVDSLLSTELRADISTKFQVVISEKVNVEELTVKGIGSIVSDAGNDIVDAVDLAAAEIDNAEQAPTQGNTNFIGADSGKGLNIPPKIIVEAFEETKKLTDQFIANADFVDYMETVNPEQTRMCVALIVEAFEQLGCSLRGANAGQRIEPIKHISQHGRLVEYLYMVLEKEARLIDIQDDTITRTAIATPVRSSKELLESLLVTHPTHIVASKLAYFTGTKLADVLIGKTDGVKIIFGDADGRELVTGLYGDWPLNKTYYEQMAEFIKRLVSKLPTNEGPLKILEMGAGTGGTTKVLIPILAQLNIPIKYTFTDLSMSFVAAARKKFKQYPFMEFRSHDIEKVPAEDLLGTQHVIIASNAVHATHSLTESTRNIHKALRPDGFLMMLEMTSTVVWIDIIFGLLEGWWLFDDGRRHAIAHQSRWEHDLKSVGFGHVDWTDGRNPEVNIERIIIALASGPRYDRSGVSPVATKVSVTDFTTRQAVVDRHIEMSTSGFRVSDKLAWDMSSTVKHQVVLITGATGSLGSHCLAYFANLQDVKTVVCINRRSSGQSAEARQLLALESRGIQLGSHALAKLKIFGTGCAKPTLGLPMDVYEELASSVTHILHNAWPMSARRPVEGFVVQFRVMRNLVDFAAEISRHRISRVSFQFVSSIATVGHYPIWSGNVDVPEERMAIESVLPNGYGDAKFVCERILDKTLHKHPDRFRAMVVRPGQIAGSTTNGYWNTQEHLPFLIRSAQTLKALPDFRGLLSWTPVNDVAAAIGELLVAENDPYPYYHIDNPVRQPWTNMIQLLADTLDIPRNNVISPHDWFRRVRMFSGSELENPAVKLIEFLDDNFIRMSCGGLLLNTTKSREHSKTLANVGPVDDVVAKRYIRAWKSAGFLH